MDIQSSAISFSSMGIGLGDHCSSSTFRFFCGGGVFISSLIVFVFSNVVCEKNPRFFDFSAIIQTCQPKGNESDCKMVHLKCDKYEKKA